jgi:hypothetical protein
MKRMLYWFSALAFFAPFAVGALTWTEESAEFVFPGAGAVKNPVSAVSPSAFSCRVETRAGISKILYSIPSMARNAKMNVFNATGTLLASFDLIPGAGSVRLNASGHSVAAGVYWAVIKYGNIQKISKFSIVR